MTVPGNILVRIPAVIVANFLVLSSCLGQTIFSFSDSAMRERMKRDVYYLASDTLQGRKSGTFAEKLAYDYIIDQFREAGLQPKGADSGSYLQAVPYISHSFESQKMLLRKGDKHFQYYHDFGAAGCSSNGSAKGLLADAGNGLAYLDKALSANAKIIDLKGRIAVLDLALPSALEDDTAFSAKNRIEALARHGAAGVVTWNPKTKGLARLFNFDNYDTLRIPVIYVNTSTLDSLITPPGDTVFMAVKVTRATDTYHNVVGYIDNHAPYTIIFGAHYDHVGISAKTRNVRNGADDNASGTAMIMELARYYGAGNDTLSNYLFIAFSGEEEWLIGSKYYAAHPTIDLSKADFMFNFDMVGRLGCKGNVVEVICTATSPDWKKILRETPRDGFRIKTVKGAGEFSDHHPFYKKNIPISYLTTGMHYDYHTSRDDADRINYDGMNSILSFAKGILSGAENTGRVRFQEVSGWDNFTSMWYYVTEEIDFLLTPGTREAMEE